MNRVGLIAILFVATLIGAAIPLGLSAADLARGSLRVGAAAAAPSVGAPPAEAATAPARTAEQPAASQPGSSRPAELAAPSDEGADTPDDEAEMADAAPMETEAEEAP